MGKFLEQFKIVIIYAKQFKIFIIDAKQFKRSKLYINEV